MLPLILFVLVNNCYSFNSNIGRRAPGNRGSANIFLVRSPKLVEIGAPSADPKIRADSKFLAEANALVATIVSESSKGSSRDIGLISSNAETLTKLALQPGLSVSDRAMSLVGDWKLAFASSSDALGVVGTGLHNVPLTKMEDLFISIRGNGKKTKEVPSSVEVCEVLRVIGPFPNVRNTLTGACVPGRDAALTFSYTKMIDGNGGVIQAKDGGTQRVVRFEGAYVNDKCLVLTAASSREAQDVLVFTREADLDGELKKLRVDRPPDWDVPKAPTPFKFPWSS